jgi:TonB family protein
MISLSVAASICALCLVTDTPPSIRVPAPQHVDTLSAGNLRVVALRADRSVLPDTSWLSSITNWHELAPAISKRFPPQVKDSLFVAHVWTYVDEQGTPYPYEVVRSSGYAELDSVAIGAVRDARMTPPVVAGAIEPVWMSLAIPLRRQFAKVKKVAATGIVRPELVNRPQIARELVAKYPPELRKRGISGSVLVLVLVDENGVVLETDIKKGGGYIEFDRAAHDVARSMRFTPAFYRGLPVRVWTQIPLMFRQMQ